MADKREPPPDLFDEEEQIIDDEPEATAEPVKDKESENVDDTVEISLDGGTKKVKKEDEVVEKPTSKGDASEKKDVVEKEEDDLDKKQRVSTDTEKVPEEKFSDETERATQREDKVCQVCWLSSVLHLKDLHCKITT